MDRAAQTAKRAEVAVGEPMRAFSRSLPMLLLRAREAVMNRFRPNLRDHGFTDQQWRALRSLADNGEMQLSALAEDCCLLLPSLSRIIQNLEERGLVSRRAGDTDLRSWVISVTAEGRALFESAAPISEARYAEITRLIGSERLEQTYDLLEDLIRVLEETEAAPSEEAQKT